MRILSRAIFREITVSAVLGVVLFTFILFLQRLGKGEIFALLLRSSAPPSEIAYLLSLIIPPTLPFTVPVGVLVGILIGLGRMSSDNEVTAIRAAGVSARTILRPVLTLAFLGLAAASAASIWLTPWAIRETLRISTRLAATQLTADIQPRIFEESFPGTVLYVGDVIAGPVTRWRKVLIADMRAPEERRPDGNILADTPPITIAEEAIANPDPERNRIQLSILNGYTYEMGRQPSEDYNSRFPVGEQVLEAQKQGDGVRVPAFSELETADLYQLIQSRPEAESIDPRIEFHQRLALPWACVLLAMIGLPLGISSRKGGKSSAFVLTVILAFSYWMGLISLIGLARQGTLPVYIAAWLPNLIFLITGLILLLRLEKPGDFDLVGWGRQKILGFFSRFKSLPAPSGTGSFRGPRLWIVPQVIDTYILNTFLFYFGLLLVSFVLMVEVFTFFELLSDIVKNQIPMHRVLTYLFFLSPKLMYESAPLAVLVAVLVTFGVLTKNNEVTAFKACGVSMYRLAFPVLVIATAMSGALFAFDHYYVPEANRKQDAIRNEIKGRPIQTYLRPDRKWYMGQNGSRMYYYKYFEPSENVMMGVSVYDLNPETFHMRRMINAERARWEPSLNTWVFQNGQMREVDGIRVTKFHDFPQQTATFPELDESPGYFRREVKLSQQMNFIELDNYIRELSASGLDTVKLQVQLHSKFSIPLFALIMALISIPFAFLTGSRGAMAGVGASLGIAIVYFSVTKLFEQVGFLNQLPPEIAAWSPDILFSLAGLYLLIRMRT